MAPPPADDRPLHALRVDIWLDVVCLFKTRSEAQRALKGGKVDVNSRSAAPHLEDIHPGDVIEITRPLGRRQHVVVRGLVEKHLPKAEARLLYEDTTPPPSREEQAMLDLIRSGPDPSVGPGPFGHPSGTSGDGSGKPRNPAARWYTAMFVAHETGLSGQLGPDDERQSAWPLDMLRR